MATTSNSADSSLNMEFVDFCEDFLETYCQEAIDELNQKYPKEKQSIYIDVKNDMYRFEPDMLDDITERPDKVRKHMSKALTRFEQATNDFSNVHIRFENMPETHEYLPGEFPSELTGNFLRLRGQIAQLTASKPKVEEAAFECQRCGTITRVPQPSGSFQEPHECGGCERQGPFITDEDESEWVDYQMTRVQLPPEVAEESQPHIDVVFKDDLAGELPGNARVRIDGRLTIKPGSEENGVYDYLFEADAVEIEEGGYGEVEYEEYKDEIKAIAEDTPIETLKNSLLPGIHADDRLERVMEAATLQLFGASRKDPDKGSSFRGDWHMLLLGDPSTGKSELLDAVNEVAPRAKIGSGGTLSQAGLTAAAVKDDFGPQQWSVEAGLLVLANEGIACIDELDKVDESDLEATHRALEQQQIDFSKAGEQAHLPARTSLLAAGNPKYNRFDPHEPIGEQIDLPPSLMSRFDLMFMLKDEPEEDRDREIAGHVFDSWRDATAREHRDEAIDEGMVREVPPELFKAYVAYAREEIHPDFESDVDETDVQERVQQVKDRIVNQYVEVRSEGTAEDAPVPLTARKIEAFLRLAESSARARLSETIEMQDVERAIRLVMASLSQVGIDPETGEFDVDVIETGQSKSQRDRVKSIKQTVTELELEYDEGVPVDTLIEELQDEHGIDRDKVEHEIAKLKQKGEVYEPATDRLRTS